MDKATHLDDAFSTFSSVVRHMGHANVYCVSAAGSTCVAGYLIADDGSLETLARALTCRHWPECLRRPYAV